MPALFSQCPGDAVQTGTGKVDLARIFKCTKAARNFTRFTTVPFNPRTDHRGQRTMYVSLQNGGQIAETGLYATANCCLFPTQFSKVYLKISIFEYVMRLLEIIY